MHTEPSELEGVTARVREMVLKVIEPDAALDANYDTRSHGVFLAEDSDIPRQRTLAGRCTFNETGAELFVRHEFAPTKLLFDFGLDSLRSFLSKVSGGGINLCVTAVLPRRTKRKRTKNQ